MNQAYGDSYTKSGLNATAANKAYLAIVAAVLGAFDNYAIDGGMAGDMSVPATSAHLQTGDKAIVQLFTNDNRIYLNSLQTYARQFLTDVVTKLACPNRVRAMDMTRLPSGDPAGAWANSSSWASDPILNGAMQSWLLGASMSASFSGKALYVSVAKYHTLSGYTLVGQADVYVDDVKVGTISSDGTGMETTKKYTGGAATYRFGGLSDTAHTCKIVMTTDQHDVAGLVRVVSIAGSAQGQKPTVCVGDIPKWTAAAYGMYGSSDANIAAYCAITADIVSQLAADGLDVRLVQNNAALTVSDMGDNHPNDSGHAKMAAAYLTAFGSAPVAPTYTAANIVVDTAGNFFGVKTDGTGMKQLS